jgi:arylsulfatase A-like enzyme
MKNLIVTFTLLALFAIVKVASAQSKPNIVVILADDFGYASSNCYGAPESLIRTPNMNRLAEEGMRFTDASTPASVCTPTRYAMLTGRYAWRGKLKYGVLNPPEGALLIEDELHTLPEYLQQQGYQTAHIGKWHLGYTNEFNTEDLSSQPLTPGPRSMGFDYHFGVPNNIDWLPKVYIENEGIWGIRSKGRNSYGRSYYKAQPYHGYDAPQRVTTNVTQDLNDKAREWIYKCSRENPEKPFFLYFAPVAIHTPVAPADKFRGSSDCGAYGDYVQDLDHSVGEIIEALAYSGELDNTVLIFTSDNGGNTGDKEEKYARQKGLSNNGEFRGDKHTIWEGGFRVPFIARWPGHIEKGAVSDRMVNLVDIFSTVQELTSGEVLPPQKSAADSYSFYDELVGKRNESAVRPHMVVNSVNGVMAIRKGPWKFIEGVAAKKLNEGQKKHLAKELEPQLYNLEKDISETKNLINEYPKIYKELQESLDNIRTKGSERLTNK